MKLAQSKVHFIGVGGIGMSGIAELLHNLGAQVSGSDLSSNAQTQHLSSLGVKIYQGHHAHQVNGVDVVVYSSAVKSNNPEYSEARLQNIPIIPRAEALSEIMRLKRGVAVAGTHGKTTTTSLTATALIGAGFDPTIVVGGRLDVIKSTAKLGSGEWIVAEADESDGSFLKLTPEIAIITNIDNDHLDFYKSKDALYKGFLDFAGKVPFYGCVVACGDDSLVRQVLKDYSKPIFYYGFNIENDFRLEKVNEVYKIFENETVIGEFKSPLPGRHNALNSLAAIIASIKAGGEMSAVLKSLEGFNGVDRRFQFKGEINGALYFDDYGHHPTEVKAVLSAFSEKYPNRPLKVLFQPHRYTRTQDCWNEFTTCFKGVEKLYLLDIYSAGEAPISGVTSQKLSQEITGCQVQCVGNEKEDEFKFRLQEIKKGLRANEVFLTLGAGSVSRIGEAFQLL